VGDRGGKRIRLNVVNVRDALIAWYLRRGAHKTGETEPFPYGDDRFGARSAMIIAFRWEKRQKRVGGMSIAPVCRRRHTLSDCAAGAERWSLARLPRTVSASIQVHAGCGIEV
jgi:hypothetical protein